jgi:hypothetical protein
VVLEPIAKNLHLFYVKNETNSIFKSTVEKTIFFFAQTAYIESICFTFSNHQLVFVVVVVVVVVKALAFNAIICCQITCLIT